MIKRTVEISQQPVHLTVREVRVLTITDKQFERMRVFWGRMRRPAEAPPAQLELF